MTLTKRDRAVLRTVNRFRLCTSRHLQVVCFPGVRSDTVARRLRKLLDSRYIVAHAVHLASPNLYSLGSEGRRWLRGRGTDPGRVPRGNLEHHLAIVANWIDLAQFVRNHPGWELQRFIPGWELHQRPERDGVLPDAFMRLRLPDRDGSSRLVSLALELDRGTESTHQLRNKLGRYVLSGDLDVVLAVALVGATARRWAAIQHLLATVWPGQALLWNDATELGTELQRLAEFPLHGPQTNSPDDKGSPIVSTCSGATTSFHEHPRSSMKEGEPT